MALEYDLETRATLHAFLLRLFQDRTEGRELSSAEYQALFPGHEHAIAQKYAELQGERDPAESTSTATRAGHRIGRFRIVRELGRGGQGSVYLAEDPVLHRRVALKVLSAWSGISADTLRRFRREAESVSRLDHHGICPVYEAGEEAGLPYIVMRYVEGETLARRIARELQEARGRESNAAPKAGEIAAALLLHERVARTLHAAHETGIVHRDVKPGNIMVTPEGEPVLLDFGLAKDAELDASLTQSGGILGTPAYMAPEQVRGDKRLVDRRSDVYGLAASLFECVTLRRPFVAPTGDALFHAILNEEPPDACELNALVPRDLAIVLRTALEKDSAHRYQTALDFAEELRRVREREPILARPAGTILRLVRWSQRNPRIATAYGGLVAVLAVGLAVTAFLLGETRSSLREVARLSDLRALAFLAREAEQSLWPALPEKLPAMDQWLSEARSLSRNLETHRSFLADLQARSSELGPEESVELERTSAFVAELEGFLPRIAEVESRREFAATIAQRSLDEARLLWNETITALADRTKNPRYGGFALEPQVGLVPLGQDPDSGFFEFAHLQTGAVPVRSPETGRLAIDERSGLVFVLLPGGTFRMGSEPPGPDRPIGSPNVDASVSNAGGLKMIQELGPVHEVELDAFFLSKYEMTQAQWQRITGENPSEYSPAKQDHSGVATRITWRNPVTNVSWSRCQEILRRIDLVLPTEAQWEYAYRGGSSSIFYAGDDLEALAGHENLADEANAKYWQAWGEAFVEGWDDGFLAHAPVGSYLPNPFGLHDMAGNVREWCLDAWGPYLLPVTPVTGERVSEQAFRVYRGGSFEDTRNSVTAAARAGGPPHRMGWALGVRPAKPTTKAFLTALAWLEELRHQELTPEAIRSAIRIDTKHSMREHDYALRLLPEQESAAELNRAAWEIVRKPGLSSDRYAIAMQAAERANALRPGLPGLMNTLGVAQYRCGLHREALATLVRAEQSFALRGEGQQPEDLVFIALARFQLGEVAEARATLARLRSLLQDQGSMNEDVRSFLLEADAQFSRAEPDAAH